MSEPFQKESVLLVPRNYCGVLVDTPDYMAALFDLRTSGTLFGVFALAWAMSYVPEGEPILVACIPLVMGCVACVVLHLRNRGILALGRAEASELTLIHGGRLVCVGDRSELAAFEELQPLFIPPMVCQYAPWRRWHVELVFASIGAVFFIVSRFGLRLSVSGTLLIVAVVLLGMALGRRLFSPYYLRVSPGSLELIHVKRISGRLVRDWIVDLSEEIVICRFDKGVLQVWDHTANKGKVPAKTAAHVRVIALSGIGRAREFARTVFQAALYRGETPCVCRDELVG